jgi:anti-anti-sigma factor
MAFEIRHVDDAIIVRVDGRLNHDHQGEIIDTVHQNISATQKDKILMDLSQAGHLDSVGISALVGINKTVASKDCKFGIIVKDSDQKNTLLRSGMQNLFPLFDDEGDAIKSI